ncbi:MAG: zf-HC2 domain-containing protein [Ilumatobacteraceae bacterium]
MECDVVRDVLSARLDGEALADETVAAERHLTTCVECRTFAERLAVLDRNVRVRSAEPVPDLVERVVARARPARLGRANWMRPALAWVAVVMLVQSVPALVLGDASGANPHMARHLGAFGAALAIGFAYVAWRPHRAFGLLPFTGALVATTVVSAIIDTADGSVRPLSESTHIAELIGLVLLWMIAGSPGWPLRIRSVRSWRAPADRSVRPPSATT